MQVDVQKVERVTIAYESEAEMAQAYDVCRDGGYSIRDSYAIKDESMRYTGQAVLVADKPLKQDYIPQTLIGELFAMFEATFGDTTPEGNTLWAYVRHACREVERLREESDIWEKHGLVQIVEERNKFRKQLQASIELNAIREEQLRDELDLAAKDKAEIKRLQEKIERVGINGYVWGLKIAHGLCQSRARQWKKDRESGWFSPDSATSKLLDGRYLEATAIMDELQARIGANQQEKGGGGAVV